MFEFFGEPIFSYSRKQAIEDGVLVDVSETAKEAGIAVPVALTAEAWSQAVSVDEAAEGYGQSEDGRLWDVLSLLRFAAGTAADGQSVITYPVIVNDGPGKQREVELKAVIGPGDNLEPVITVMLPEEG